MKWVWLFIAGGVGTFARYFLSVGIIQSFPARFPLGTFIVNMLGCFLIGLLGAWAERKFLITADLKLYLMVGFLGAFTTFSTFILEADGLLKEANWVLAALQIGLSVAGGLLIFRLGFLLGNL